MRGRKCVVMGAGGAARSIVYGLVKEGAEVRIWNRTESKARALCEEFACELGKEGEILIQTTSFWTLKPDASQAEIDEFCPDEFVEQFEVVMEIAYSPLITPLLAKAQCMGKKIVTGEKMLLYQAFEQFKVFTGEEAPEGVMREALLRNLK